MTADPSLKKYPDYSIGYFDELEDDPAPEAPSAAYLEGRDAARRARDILRKHGFEEDAPGEFSKQMVISGGPDDRG